MSRLEQLLVRAYESTPRATADLLRARRRRSYQAAYNADPLITARIGTFQNDEILFERALSSVLRQSYANWEAIIVCDGRQPETVERIAAIGDSRLRCVERPRNGPYPPDSRARWLVAGSHPFNEGFALSRGAWIAPIDQDDEWTDDHLEVLLGTALDAHAEAVYGVTRVVVPPDRETYFGVWPPVLGEFGFQASIYHAGLTTFLYDANAHLVGEPGDWNLARRMLDAGVRFDFLDRIVTNYYLNEDADGIDWWRERAAQRGIHRA